MSNLPLWGEMVSLVDLVSSGSASAFKLRLAKAAWRSKISLTRESISPHCILEGGRGKGDLGGTSASSSDMEEREIPSRKSRSSFGGGEGILGGALSTVGLFGSALRVLGIFGRALGGVSLLQEVCADNVGDEASLGARRSLASISRSSQLLAAESHFRMISINVFVRLE